MILFILLAIGPVLGAILAPIINKFEANRKLQGDMVSRNLGPVLHKRAN